MISDSFGESIVLESEQETISGEQSYPYTNASYAPLPVKTSNSYEPEVVGDPFAGEDYLLQYSPFADPSLVDSRSVDVRNEFDRELTFESPFALEEDQEQEDWNTSEYTFESTATDSDSEFDQPFAPESEAGYFDVNDNVQETFIEGESISLDDGLVHNQNQLSFGQFEAAEDVSGEHEHGNDPIDELSEYEDLTNEDESPFSDNELFTLEDEAPVDSTDHLFELEYHIGEEKGKTIYLKTSGVKGKSLQTGVFIPAAFRNSDRVNIILYFHGLFDYGNNRDVIEKYWSTYSNLPEFVYQSNRNCILIAPGLTTNPQTAPLKFYENNGLDNYIADCLQELHANGIIGANNEAGSIIIAGHSAGGKPLSAVLKRSNKLLSNVIECWGFDCFYGYGWDKTTFTKPFYHYWAMMKNGKRTGPGNAGEAMAKLYPNLKNIGPKRTVYHPGIVEYAWVNEVNNRPWFDTGHSTQSGWLVPDVVKNVQVLGNNVMKIANDWASLSPSKRAIIMIVAGSPQITEQKALELARAQGVTDKSELTNLIFYLRHKDYLGRKLEASDAQSLKDEWTQILKNIVTPFLLNQSSNTLSRPEPTPSPSTPVSVNTANVKTSDFTLVTVPVWDQPIVLVHRNDRTRHAEILEKPSVFLKEIILKATNDQTTADEWFNNFTTITFLGRNLQQGDFVHIDMAKHLKTVEQEMAIKYGGPNADPVVAGDRLLGPVREAIAGSREVSKTATYSMHMFGLAIDVNYASNPFIQNKVREGENTKKKTKWVIPNGVVTLNNTLTNAANLTGQRIDAFSYGLTYETYTAINNALIAYLKLIDQDNDAQLRQYLATTTNTEWRSLDANAARNKVQKDLETLALSVDRWSKQDLLKQHGFFNVTKEFVDGVKLNWGGQDYGDMMHFDMRNTGVGEKINIAKNEYIRKINKRSLDEYKP